MPANLESARERFESKVSDATTSGCREYTGSVSRVNGYGYFKVAGENWLAHRISYTLAYGEPPSGLELDHLCRNRKCVNPDHLEPVTKRENQERSPLSLTGRQLARTHCPRGHDYSLRCDGARICKTCISEQQRARRVRKAAA